MRCECKQRSTAQHGLLRGALRCACSGGARGPGNQARRSGHKALDIFVRCPPPLQVPHGHHTLAEVEGQEAAEGDRARRQHGRELSRPQRGAAAGPGGGWAARAGSGRGPGDQGGC